MSGLPMAAWLLSTAAADITERRLAAANSIYTAFCAVAGGAGTPRARILTPPGCAPEPASLSYNKVLAGGLNTHWARAGGRGA